MNLIINSIYAFFSSLGFGIIFNIKGKNLFMGSRISLTGQMHGPDLNKIMEVIGKETCLNRLNYVKNNIL